MALTAFPQAKRSTLLAILFFFFLPIILLLHLWIVRGAYDLDDVYDPPIIPSTSPAADFTRDDSSAPRVLLVSALYLLPQSKHSPETYTDWWVPKFLEAITTDIYFYMPPNVASLERMVQQRPKHLSLVVDTNYTTPFDIPPLKGNEHAYEKMHEIDPHKDVLGPHLYAVWNAKPFFLDNAVKVLAAQGKTYDYVFWNDAGSFREGYSTYSGWPDPHRVDHLFSEAARSMGMPKEDLFFVPLSNLPREYSENWKESDGPIVSGDLSEGSFFGGTPHAAEWWAKTYYTYHDHWLKMGYFVGDDQEIINGLLHLFPERFFIVNTYDRRAPARGGLTPGVHYKSLGTCGPEWYYYQFWLSNRETRDEMRRKWMGLAKEQTEKWFHARIPCRLTRFLPMLDAFHQSFGDSWKHPAPSLISG